MNILWVDGVVFRTRRPVLEQMGLAKMAYKWATSVFGCCSNTSQIFRLRSSPNTFLTLEHTPSAMSVCRIALRITYGSSWALQVSLWVLAPRLRLSGPSQSILLLQYCLELFLPIEENFPLRLFFQTDSAVWAYMTLWRLLGRGGGTFPWFDSPVLLFYYSCLSYWSIMTITHTYRGKKERGKRSGDFFHWRVIVGFLWWFYLTSSK